MRSSKLFGKTLRQAPSGTENISHKLLVRAGFIQQIASGIFSAMPLGNRSLSKIKNIIREEMDRVERIHMIGRFSGGERAFEKKKKELREALKEATEAQKEGGGMRELKDSVRETERLQEDSHKSVEKAVKKAQEAHDLMVELSEEVDRLRKKANTAHNGLTGSKRESDSLHGQYIVSLRCIHSIQDMMKAMESREKKEEEYGDEEKVEVTDLMSRLMSGDTLSTDELMALRRN